MAQAVSIAAPQRLETGLGRSREMIELGTQLRMNEFSPAIAGVGAMNQVELRCADAALQVLVNGQPLVTLEDASFGFGRFGYQIGAFQGPMYPPKSRIVVRGVELFHLA